MMFHCNVSCTTVCNFLFFLYHIKCVTGRWRFYKSAKTHKHKFKILEGFLQGRLKIFVQNLWREFMFSWQTEIWPCVFRVFALYFVELHSFGVYFLYGGKAVWAFKFAVVKIIREESSAPVMGNCDLRLRSFMYLRWTTATAVTYVR